MVSVPFPLVVAAPMHCSQIFHFFEVQRLLDHTMLIRTFSTSAVRGRTGYSTVQPVHHLVKINKNALKPKLAQLLKPADDITSVKFKPTEIDQDRVAEYYRNTLQLEIMLHCYQHGAELIKGNKLRSWGNDSPYKMYRQLKKPAQTLKQTKDIHPITHRNVPELELIVVQAYNKNALEELWLNITTKLQLAQLTNVRPKQLYSRSNILPWKTHVGKPCGAKVELTGRDMHQFMSTLTELVLPRIRTFRGVYNLTGDKQGNISLGLDAEDVKMFPEIEQFQELYPNLCGINITFKTSARTDEDARTLVSAFGFPFCNRR